MQGVRSLAGEVRNESPCAQVDDAFGTTLEDISSARDDRSTVFASTIWQSLYRKSKRVVQAFRAQQTIRNARNVAGKHASVVTRLLAIPSAITGDLLLRFNFDPFALVQPPFERRTDNRRSHNAFVRGPV
jgi:hypothetical protein